jgi:hypothetical protein
MQFATASQVTRQSVSQSSNNAEPGFGLSGSADLASEASYEADRSGPNPARNSTTEAKNQITTGSGSSRMPNRSYTLV